MTDLLPILINLTQHNSIKVQHDGSRIQLVCNMYDYSVLIDAPPSKMKELADAIYAKIKAMN